MAGQSNDNILDFLDSHDPITRSNRNVDELMDVYIDRTYRTFLESANPSPDSAREQISGLIEGLTGATRVVRELGGQRYEWSTDKNFVRDLMTGQALKPIADLITSEEKQSTGLDGLARNTDPSGAAMQRFLDESGRGEGLSRLSDESVLRVVKKVWPIWEKIGDLSRSEPRISVPDFSTNPGTVKKLKMITVRVEKESSQTLAGHLVRKGGQMAYKARADQGKQVRNLILLGDALGILGGSIITNPKFIDRDDNLARALSASTDTNRKFPVGSPYLQPGVLKEVTEKILQLERDARIQRAAPLQKYESTRQYQVVIRSAPGVDVQMKMSVFDEPADISGSLPKNISQKRRGRTPSHETFTQAEPLAKRPTRLQDVQARVIASDPRKRPTGAISRPDRLRVRTDRAINARRLPNAGAILKNVRPSNPESILTANQELTSTSVPKSNIVDPTAAGMQSELVRNQKHAGPDDNVRLKSSCLQNANAKSVAELARKTQLLEKTTNQVRILSEQLIKARQVSADKIRLIEGDNDSLKENFHSAKVRLEEALAQTKDVKVKYDKQCQQWRALKFTNVDLTKRLGDIRQEQAKDRHENTSRVKIIEQQLGVLRNATEKFGAQKEEERRRTSALEDRLELANKDLERQVQSGLRRIDDIEGQQGRLKDENYRLSEANEQVMAQQMRLRNELQMANEQVEQSSQQMDWVGKDNEEKDKNILELQGQIRDMRGQLVEAHRLVQSKELVLLANASEARVIVGQYQRQLGISGELVFQKQNLERSLMESEEELNASRNQCKYNVEDADMYEVGTSGAGGGRDGGGFGGLPGGATIRPIPEWMDKGKTDLDYGHGDEPWLPAPAFEVDGEDGGNGGVLLALLLLVIVAVYMSYR